MLACILLMCIPPYMSLDLYFVIVCFQRGKTALMYAFSFGNLDIVRMLISERNANIDIQDQVTAFVPA